jgi:DNA-directed RNA polymerase subunit L
MFENIVREGNITTFRLTPIHVTYANTLRRVILTGVETVAFRADMKEDGSTSDVVIEKNDTAMTNEMLADRIGLLPLDIKDPLHWKADKYTFKLDVTNTGDKPLDVVSANFKVFENRDDSDEPVEVNSDRFFPPNPITKDTHLIAILRPKGLGGTQGETITLSARATIGKGRQHARYIPISQCSYIYTLDDNEEKIKTAFNKWLISQKNLDPNTLADDKKQVYLREFNTMEIQRCYRVNEKGEPNSFDFTIETIGPLSVAYIVMRACDVIESMCNRYTTFNIGELPTKVRIQPAEGRVIGQDVIFEEQDHTLGNLLQTWIVENMVLKEHSSGIKVTFAGYKVPHPLVDEMVLRICALDRTGVPDKSEDTVREVIALAAKGCIQIFAAIKEDWTTKTGAHVAVPSYKVSVKPTSGTAAVSAKSKTAIPVTKKSTGVKITEEYE